MIRAGIIGATGYTGFELLKLLQRHPAVDVAWLTSESSGGQAFGDIFPVSPALGRYELIPLEQANLSVDLVFCCLPGTGRRLYDCQAGRLRKIQPASERILAWLATELGLFAAGHTGTSRGLPGKAAGKNRLIYVSEDFQQGIIHGPIRHQRDHSGQLAAE